jgi:HK97 gp10 family phage protein
MKVTMKMTGLREVEQMLTELPKAVGKRVLTKALMAGGEVIASAARTRAPVLTGNLRESVNVTAVKPKDHDAGKAAFGVGLRAGLSRGQAVGLARTANRAAGYDFAEVFVGTPAQAVPAWPQELGTINHPAQPFLRPAFEATKQRAADTIAFELFFEIERAAQRYRSRGR